MAAIVVRRDHDWSGRARRVKVHVDNEVLDLRRRAEVRVEVLRGEHTVRTSLDWTSSPTAHLVLADHDEVVLQTRGRGNPVYLLWPSNGLGLDVDEPDHRVRLEVSPWTRRQLAVPVLAVAFFVTWSFLGGWLADHLF